MIVLKRSFVLEKQAVKWKWKYRLKKVNKWRFSYFQVRKLIKNTKEFNLNNLITRNTKQRNGMFVKMFELYLPNSRVN